MAWSADRPGVSGILLKHSIEVSQLLALTQPHVYVVVFHPVWEIQPGLTKQFQGLLYQYYTLKCVNKCRSNDECMCEKVVYIEAFSAMRENQD